MKKSVMEIDCRDVREEREREQSRGENIQKS